MRGEGNGYPFPSPLISPHNKFYISIFCYIFQYYIIDFDCKIWYNVPIDAYVQKRQPDPLPLLERAATLESKPPSRQAER
jgi:hypothetical protein